MASEIHPVSATTGQIEYAIGFTKTDGSAGEIEPGSLVMDPVDPALAEIVMNGEISVKVRHVGGDGQVTLSGSADGDKGEGRARFGLIPEVITMLPPLGATAGGFTPMGSEGPVS